MKKLSTLMLLLMAYCFCCAQDSDEVGGRHDNVNVVLLGDSNTWNGGFYCDNPTSWSTWFVRFFMPKTCSNLSRSGATWTNTSNTTCNIADSTAVLDDNNVIYNQVERLKEAYLSGSQVCPELIVVAAGTNDAWFQSHRPGLFSKSVDEAFAVDEDVLMGKPANEVLTLAESIRYSCLLLKRLFPESTIVLLTPMQSVKIKNADIHLTGDVIEQCASKLQLPCIRQDYKNSVVRTKEMKKKVFTIDGTHTSELGGKANGRLLAEKISKVLEEK